MIYIFWTLPISAKSMCQTANFIKFYEQLSIIVTTIAMPMASNVIQFVTKLTIFPSWGT